MFKIFAFVLALLVLGTPLVCFGANDICDCALCCDTTGVFGQDQSDSYAGYPTEGAQKVLVVFARVKGESSYASHPCWQDWPVDQDLPDYASSLLCPSTDPDSFYEPSLSDYYKKMSCGEYTFYGGYYPSVVETDNPSWGCANIPGIDKEVVQKAIDDTTFNFADYDVSPEDGIVDLLILIWRNERCGYAHPMAFPGDTIYAWDGTGVAGYNCTHIPYAGNLTQVISIHGHEHGHRTGLPLSAYVGVYGVHTRYSSRGMTMSAPERESVGWLDSVILVESDTVGIELPETNLSGTAIKVPILDASEDSVEYFLIENRQRKDWYSMDGDLQQTCLPFPGTGLLIWHVDETYRPEYNYYGINRKEVDLESASGMFHKGPRQILYDPPPDSLPDPIHGWDGLDTLGCDPDGHSRCDSFDFFSDEWNNTFTPYTNPNTNTYYYNPDRPGVTYEKYEQSVPTGISITNIRRGTGDSYLLDIHFNTPADTIVDDTHWGKWVILNGDVVVGENATLTIEPGAVVSAAPDTDFCLAGEDTSVTELRAVGQLLAYGTDSEPIVFRAAGVGRGHIPEAGDWYGVGLSTDDSDTLRYCDIGHAQNGIKYIGGSGSTSMLLRDINVHDADYGVALGVGMNSRLRVASCTIADCPIAGVGLSGFWRHVVLDSCEITDNAKGISALGNIDAPFGYEDTLVVSWCQIEDNTTGVYAKFPCHVILGDVQSGLGRKNSIVNDSLNVNNATGDTLMAERNWWGSNPPDSSKFVGPVDFTPWLNTSPFGLGQGQFALPGRDPSSTEVGRISPNPSSGMVEFGLTASGEDELSVHVFDVKGRMLRTLVDGESLPSGTYRVLWDGRDSSGNQVGPGIYFCRIQAKGFEDTRKVVLLR